MLAFHSSNPRFDLVVHSLVSFLETNILSALLAREVLIGNCSLVPAYIWITVVLTIPSTMAGSVTSFLLPAILSFLLQLYQDKPRGLLF